VVSLPNSWMVVVVRGTWVSFTWKRSCLSSSQMCEGVFAWLKEVMVFLGQ
jgi:hypothetical protein